MQIVLKAFDIVRHHLYIYLLIFITGSLVVSSYLILKFESNYPDSAINSVNDAIWWSAVGISTIGIGNVLPESNSGRYLTLFLTIVGVITLSVFTAKIAAFFTEEEVKEDLNKVEKDLEGELAVDDRQIEAKLDTLEKEVVELKKKKK